MARRGRIITYSVIRSAADEFKDQVPYVVALVDEGGQVRLARIEGYADGDVIEVGGEVALSGKDGSGNPVYRFMEASR